METNNNNDNKIRKVIFNEISFIIAIIGVTISIILWMTTNNSSINDKVLILQEKVNKIESNDLPHIDAKLNIIQEEVVNIRLDIKELRTILDK